MEAEEGGDRAIELYNETQPEVDEVPVAPEWPPYCNPAYIMPATIQVKKNPLSTDLMKASFVLLRDML
jgi:hypothetical protein